jgi:hypothetical protein
VSRSQKATAHLDPTGRTIAGTAAAEPRTQTAIFVVASPRPQVGKTFVARLLVDFLRIDGGSVAAFDINPSGDALHDYLPAFATAYDLGDIMDQMALFDRLIIDDRVAKIVDLGHASFDRFFSITEEIGFLRETRRRSIEPMIMFAADPHPIAVRAYADLRGRVKNALIVPVLNDAILQAQEVRDLYPVARASAVPLQIPALEPVLRGELDKARCSFLDVYERLPVPIPIRRALELQVWTRRAFVEFRKLELQLLLERLRAALPGVEL